MIAATSLMGSSPLTRGKLLRVQQGVDVAGLIPAHAGKTDAEPGPAEVPQAHPRSRGENPVGVLPGEASPGLIPAHAGKTRTLWADAPRHTAHPRSRGENTS